MKNSYRNLWHDPKAKQYGPAIYENDQKCLLIYRDVHIFHTQGGYDLVFKGACITQRAGISKAEKAIDDILDGKSPSCQAVADHISSNGGKGLSYDEYMKAVERGEMK